MLSGEACARRLWDLVKSKEETNTSCLPENIRSGINVQFPLTREVKGIFFFSGFCFDAKPGISQLHLRPLSAVAEAVVRIEVGRINKCTIV